MAAGDVNSYIDTGSFLFNALLSGTIHGGLPSNKITALAGESATGKTYFALGMVKNFLDSNPDAGVLYFESESAIPKELIVNRGIDPKRMVILPVVTIQEFRTQIIKILMHIWNQTNRNQHVRFGFQVIFNYEVICRYGPGQKLEI